MAILNKKQKNAATAKRGYVPSHEIVKSVTEPKEVTFSHLTKRGPSGPLLVMIMQVTEFRQRSRISSSSKLNVSQQTFHHPLLPTNRKQRCSTPHPQPKVGRDIQKNISGLKLHATNKQEYTAQTIQLSTAP